MKGSKRLVQQRRHADHEAQRHRHQRRPAGSPAPTRPSECASWMRDALVVRPVVVERVATAASTTVAPICASVGKAACVLACCPGPCPSSSGTRSARPSCRPRRRRAAAGSVASVPDAPGTTQRAAAATPAPPCRLQALVQRSCRSHLADGEALDVLLGLGRVELLAHDLELRVRAFRRASGPAAFICFFASVSRNTFSAICL